MNTLCLARAFLCSVIALAAVPVAAAVPASLYDTANCTKENNPPLSYVFCNDGLPSAGGTTANQGGVKAVTVPAEYDGYAGLPQKKTPTTVRGADTNGDIALDVDVSIPLTSPPEGGYPLLVFMHGCCSGTKTSWETESFDAAGEKWHYSNAWFASRGYVVINYTARGFASAPPNRQGSTGETQIDSRLYEINDFQHLACQIYANGNNWTNVQGAGGGSPVAINPQRVVVTGGSYGGGFSWMALTDPAWTCTAAETGVAQDTPMKLAAAAPRYGWTDLLYSLVPTGRHSSDPARLPDTEGCDSGPRKADGSDCADPVPAGVPKESILAGLFGTGVVGATFPQSIVDAFACLQSEYPPETNPLCTSTLQNTLPEFMRDRSAYYQNDFFTAIAADPSLRIPVFNAATFTDPLFPPHENRRMLNRLQQAAGGNYPIESYFGDYQHFVQNKAKEWGDLCGTDHDVCTNEDYAGNYNDFPASAARIGVTTRLNRFIDHYAKPASNPSQSAPPFGVTAALTVCPQKATATQPADEPGARYSAAGYAGLSNGTLELDSAAGSLTAAAGRNTTVSSSGGGTHADPIAVFQSPNPNKCPTRAANDPAPANVAQFETAAQERNVILLGAPVITVEFTHSGSADSVQLHARLYEVLSNGDAVMASRGFRRLSTTEVAAKTVSFELFDNGWEFTQGNKIRIELTQDDSPYLKSSAPASSLTLTRVSTSLPIRSATTTTGGGGGITGRGGGGGGALGLGLLAGLLLLPLVWRRR